MSILPLLLREFCPTLRHPPHRHNQNYGLDFGIDDLLTQLALHPEQNSVLQNYFRLWRSAASENDSGVTSVKDKDKFQVSIDVQQFSPEEVSVKTTDDNCIVVEGKHEERQDEHGFISRHFVRRYVLPEGHDAKDVFSNLSCDGVLTITAPKKSLPKSTERVVPINHTGPVKTVAEKKEKNETPSENNEKK